MADLGLPTTSEMNQKIAQFANHDVAKNLKSFFTTNQKTIQKNFRFDVKFYYNNPSIGGEIELGSITPWHILKVTFPSANNFRMEPIKVGPYHYGFPVMDTTGYDVVITFEEDSIGTIFNFIQFLQSIIVNNTESKLANGNYRSQLDNRLTSIIINIYNDSGNIVKTVTFRDCFFLNASSMDLDYGGSDSIKYTVTFHSDLMEQRVGIHIEDSTYEL